MNNRYQCFGRDLTSDCARKLIQELFEGQTVRRREIVNTVFEVHHKRGGGNSGVRLHVIKSALKSMKESGVAENVELGFWYILQKANPEPHTESLQSPKTKEELVNPDLDSIKTIGAGKNSVYLYYYPTYRSFAESQGETDWPCKIGKSESIDPAIRINSQTATALPENPVVGLIIRTDSPDTIEWAIHEFLGNKHMQNAPGKEWFMTHPNEVQEIHEKVLKIRET